MKTTITKIFEPGELSSLELPLLEDVPAGFPSPAADYIDKSLDLNEHLIKNKNSTYFVKVAGTSMLNAGIFDGDILIVDRSLAPDHNRIVIAVIDGELTVKRIKKVNGTLFLAPENDNFKPIPLTDDIDFQVWGVVTNSIHNHY